MKEFTNVAREVARKKNERSRFFLRMLSCKKGRGIWGIGGSSMNKMTVPTKGLGGVGMEGMILEGLFSFQVADGFSLVV